METSLGPGKFIPSSSRWHPTISSKLLKRPHLSSHPPTYPWYSRPRLVGQAPFRQDIANSAHGTRSSTTEGPHLHATPPGPGPDRLAQTLAATQGRAGCDPAIADFFAKFTAELKARRKKYNDMSKQRKRDRELLALKTQAELSRGGEDRQPSVGGSAGLRAGGAR